MNDSNVSCNILQGQQDTTLISKSFFDMDIPLTPL